MSDQRVSQFLNRIEVTIMRYHSSCHFPYPFDWIKVRRIRRKINTNQLSLVFSQKCFHLFTRVPASIVQNKVICTFNLIKKMAYKTYKIVPIKDFTFTCKKLSALNIDQTKEADILSRRSRDYLGLFSFERPRPYKGTVAPKMDFVFRPYLDIRVFYPFLVLFFNSSCLAGLAS